MTPTKTGHQHDILHPCPKYRNIRSALSGLREVAQDRRERRLELDDIRAYCRIVTALEKTIELQDEIDAIYPTAEKQTVAVPEA